MITLPTLHLPKWDVLLKILRESEGGDIWLRGESSLRRDGGFG
jgi:hypothetical protein